MNSFSDGFFCGTRLICGIGEGRLRSGGDGIGDGGSISNGILLISLLGLRELLGLWLFRLGFLGG
jgi:hypothetical protein